MSIALKIIDFWKNDVWTLIISTFQDHADFCSQISHMLLAVESGRLHEFKGKPLSQIHVEELEGMLFHGILSRRPSIYAYQLLLRSADVLSVDKQTKNQYTFMVLPVLHYGFYSISCCVFESFSFC